MANVTKITEYKTREVVAALEELLEQARRGEISGFAFACKFGDRHHGIGLTGDYRKDPLPVLAVTARISARINQILDGRQ